MRLKWLVEEKELKKIYQQSSSVSIYKRDISGVQQFERHKRRYIILRSWPHFSRGSLREEFRHNDPKLKKRDKEERKEMRSNRSIGFIFFLKNCTVKLVFTDGLMCF